MFVEVIYPLMLGFIESNLHWLNSIMGVRDVFRKCQCLKTSHRLSTFRLSLNSKMIKCKKEVRFWDLEQWHVVNVSGNFCCKLRRKQTLLFSEKFLFICLINAFQVQREVFFPSVSKVNIFPLLVPFSYN